MGERGGDHVVPKLRLEMVATRSDTTKLAWFAESPCPTIILVGEKTLLAPRAVARQLQFALGAALVIVPGAAHMIPITHPHAILDAIRMERIEE
jgi:pimeloyl-ACP methyl ester carboxylesterase